MKANLAVLIVLLPFLALAGSTTPEELARSYIAAVQSHDAAAIRKLVHPKFLDGLKSDDVKLLDGWIRNSIADAPKLKDPMSIDSKGLSPANVASMSQGENCIWNIPPELQIEMQSYRDLGNGQHEGSFLTVLFAAKYQGQLYLVFQLPK